MSGIMVKDEKLRATILGVAAASFLTGLKLVAGILSNSLAVLAEAAHSALDLASAVTGFFAIRLSDRPADREHQYGHGKADSVGGFFAALFLLITCFWIIFEGITRLMHGTVELDVTLLTIAVIMISITVDAERTLVFRRIGKKTGSPTIQGESLHFASDIASSSAVLGGLFFITWGYTSVDTYLALGISVYFFYTSVSLIVARINDFLDKVPSELSAKIEKTVKGIKGVTACDRVRVRKSGAKMFMDVVVSVDPRTSLVASHKIASQVEKAIGKRFKESDVLVHVNPSSHKEELIDRIRDIALNEGAKGVHGVDVESYGEDLRVSVHLEFSPSTPLRRAHRIASRVESRVKSLPKVTEALTHIEPEKQQNGALKREGGGLANKIREVAKTQKGVESCHDVFIAEVGKKYHVTMHCTFDERLSVERVHEISTNLEEQVIREVQDVADVVVHSEPISRSVMRP
jgi:cation diffusion facilitator family transporter